MDDLKTRIIDWLDGYTEADMASACAKMDVPRSPGEVIQMTRGEMKAWLDSCCVDPTHRELIGGCNPPWDWVLIFITLAMPVLIAGSLVLIIVVGLL